MKMSGGVEWALHCVLALTAADRPVPAARLAAMHDMSGSYLAKQLQALSRAGLVRSAQGHAGGYSLTRPADEITVLDVVEAVDGPQPPFVCTEIRQRGPMGSPPERCTLPCTIAATMATADEAWRASLRAVTIADLATTLTDKSGPGVLAGMRTWLST